MQNGVGLDQITDIKELKALKADQYDLLEQADRLLQQSRATIQLINGRIAYLQQREAERSIDKKTEGVDA